MVCADVVVLDDRLVDVSLRLKDLWILDTIRSERRGEEGETLLPILPRGSREMGEGAETRRDDLGMGSDDEREESFLPEERSGESHWASHSLFSIRL